MSVMTIFDEFNSRHWGIKIEPEGSGYLYFGNYLVSIRYSQDGEYRPVGSFNIDEIVFSKMTVIDNLQLIDLAETIKKFRNSYSG